MYCTLNDAECKQPDSCAERGCFTERVRSQHLGVRAKDSTRRTPLPKPVTQPSWEKATAYEERPGGFQMPYIAPGSGSPMGIKEASERRNEIKRIRDRQRHDPHVFR